MIFDKDREKSDRIMTRGSQNRDFIFIQEKYKINIKYPVTVPLPIGVTISEIAHHICQINNIPANVEQELINELDEFVDKETEKCELEPFESAQNAFLKDFQARSDHLLAFDKLTWNKTRGKDLDRLYDEESKFYEKYHELLHSGFLVEPIVLLEHSYRTAIQDLVVRKQNEIKNICEEQSEETEKLVKLIDNGVTEEDINRLSLKYVKKCEASRSKWDQSIEDLQASQKKEFRMWIDKIYDDYSNNMSKECLINKISERSNSLLKGEEVNDQEAEEPPLEESFTINLGSQLKSSHNLRLKAAHALDLCDLMPK